MRPGHIDRSDCDHLFIGQPEGDISVHPRSRQVTIVIVPERSIPGADQHDHPWFDGNLLSSRAGFQFVDSDDIAGIQGIDTAMPGYIQKYSWRHNWGNFLYAVPFETSPSCDFINRYPTVEHLVFGPVGKGVDVCAAMLHGHNHTGCSGTRSIRGIQNIGMAAMQKVGVAGEMRFVDGHTLKSGLLQVEDDDHLMLDSTGCWFDHDTLSNGFPSKTRHQMIRCRHGIVGYCPRCEGAFHAHGFLAGGTMRPESVFVPFFSIELVKAMARMDNFSGPSVYGVQAGSVAPFLDVSLPVCATYDV